MAMLSTIDNPYNPYTDFKEWFLYDTTVLKYNTCGYLSRVIDLLASDPSVKKRMDIMEDYDHRINDIAIDDIVNNDPFGIYYKVFDSD